MNHLFPRKLKIADIVLSDFGRDAAIRYLQEFSMVERQHIQAKIGEENIFFDEYRMVGITLVAYLGYIKSEKLQHYYEQRIPLDEGILVGFNKHYQVKDLEPKIARLMLRHAAVASDVNPDSIRLIIPCNTHTGTAMYLRRIVTNPDHLANLLLGIDGTQNKNIVTKLLRTTITVPTIPSAVVKHLLLKKVRRVAILATPSVTEFYERELQKYHGRIQSIRLTGPQQDNINQAIINAIDGRENKAKDGLDQLRSRVVAPLSREYPDIQFVEACTDLNYGIGVDSNRIFAAEMVRQAYS